MNKKVTIVCLFIFLLIPINLAFANDVGVTICKNCPSIEIKNVVNIGDVVSFQITMGAYDSGSIYVSGVKHRSSKDVKKSLFSITWDETRYNFSPDNIVFYPHSIWNDRTEATLFKVFVNDVEVWNGSMGYSNEEPPEEPVVIVTPPFNLMLSDVTNTSAFLKWETLNSYFRIYNSDGTLYKDNIIPKEYRFINLLPNTEYSFYATRVSDNNIESDPSEIVTFKTLTNEEWEVHPDNPDRKNNIPINLKAEIGDKQITVSWDYEGSIKGFYLYKDGERVNNNMVASLMSYSEDYLITSKSYTVRGLDNGKKYSFQVSAVNDAGEESEKSQVVTAIPEPLMPSIPTELMVGNGDSLLNLRWRANPESNITGYNVYLNGLKVNTSPVTGTSYRIDAVENGTSYSVQISALNSYGNESAMTQVVQGLPKESFIPTVPLKNSFNLKDIADGTANWFGGLWLIIAFAVSIPLAFLIANKTKETFLT